MKSAKILPPTYFNGTFIMMIIMHFVFPVLDLIDYPINLLGLIFILIGIVLNLWTDRLFKNYATTVKPSEEPVELIIEGPFRFSRNPMYLGMVAILLGVFIFLGSLSSFILIPIFAVLIHKNFIKAEEESLEKIFGKQFVKYKDRVRRWL